MFPLFIYIYITILDSWRSQETSGFIIICFFFINILVYVYTTLYRKEEVE